MSNQYYSSERNIQIVVALLKEYGIRKVIASPGTTNLTFVASIQQDPFFEIYSAPEERSAAYMAVGMSEESGEPVVITCTGATASRNYMPGLTEAFYRKLPVIAITATQSRSNVGQLVPQVIDRSVLPNDVAVFSAHINSISSDADARWATLKVNEAFYALHRNGGGPVHLNLETTYEMKFSAKELPKVKKIDFYQSGDNLPELKGRIGIYIGSHSAFDAELTELIDNFCMAWDSAVYVDHTSNYKGKFRLQNEIVLSQDSWRSPLSSLDIMIYIGEVSGSYTHPSAKETWRISEDGCIRDPFWNLKRVFDMSEKDFFRFYAAQGERNSSKYYDECMGVLDETLAMIPELPLSNIWIAQQLSPKIPENSVMHFGILNSLRSWNFFELPLSVNTYSNVGGFGIDGPLSTIIGGALAQQNKIHFMIVGDLAFFYDMNSLGNRHLPNNLRILLVNNGRGTEFRNYNHPASRFGDEADRFMAAGGHYGHQSPVLIRHYAEDLGFDYNSANCKEDVLSQIDWFTNTDMTPRPLLLEVFTDSTLEDKALHLIRNLRVGTASKSEQIARGFLGRRGIEIAKKILR